MQNDGAAVDPGELVRALGAAEAWPSESATPEVIQTHISVLVLVGERVFKIKKALDLGFLDYSTLEKRRHFCEEEVRLNRRLAPDVYMGVSPVLRTRDGGLRVGAPGEQASHDQIVDWAVCMRRLPADRMLEALLEAGEVDEALLEDLARVLVDFHASAARGPEIDRFGMPDVVAFNARENFEQLAPFAGKALPARFLAFLERRANRFLDTRADLFLTRVREGRICEGHGDLHASNICATATGLVIYDCIEFSERFRCADVAADLSFLAMDLDERGSSALGRQLVERYAALAGDAGLLEVIGFYKGYRAVVRGKVAAITSQEPEIPAEARAEKRLEALRYLLLAARYELGPALIVMCGLPASGKSTVARFLAHTFDAEWMRSDVRRKELLGLDATTRIQPGYGQGLYSEEQKARTYDSLLETARAELRAGRSVVVDASFPSAKERARFTGAAEALGAPAIVVWVHADEALTRARMEARSKDASEPSDADLTVWKAARKHFEEPTENVVRIESESRSLEEEGVALVERWIDAAGI